MDKFELLPTEENLVDALQRNELGRNDDLVAFYEMLFAQDGPCAIAIDGHWGSGKTFFVKQMQLLINAMNKISIMDEEKRSKIIRSVNFSESRKESSNYEIAVYFDAWENDDAQEPLTAIIFEIAKQLGLEYMIEDKEIFKKALSFIDLITNRNFSAVKAAFESDDPISELKNQKNIKNNIEEFLSQAMYEKGDRLVVFIDELDRCNPHYAVKLLEQIKHYVNDDKITFVFSTNLQELQHTIKSFYGAEYDASRYLDRFFDWTIVLPTIDFEKYCEKLGMNRSNRFEWSCKRVSQMFNFEMRDICRLYSQAKVAAYKPTHSREYDFSFPDRAGEELILKYIVPLLIGLNIYNIDECKSFINGQNSKPLHDLFEDFQENAFFFNSLLARSETLDEGEGKVTVTKYDLIEKIYDAVFVETYSGYTYSKSVGDYCFNKTSKNFAMKSASMMSLYADFSNS